MVVAHVYVRSADGEHRLVRLLPAAICYRQVPGAPKVDRPGHDNVALLVLQPGRVDRLPVDRIYHNLRIKLAGRKGKQSP